MGWSHHWLAPTPTNRGRHGRRSAGRPAATERPRHRNSADQSGWRTVPASPARGRCLDRGVPRTCANHWHDDRGPTKRDGPPATHRRRRIKGRGRPGHPPSATAAGGPTIKISPGPAPRPTRWSRTMERAALTHTACVVCAPRAVRTWRAPVEVPLPCTKVDSFEWTKQDCFSLRQKSLSKDAQRPWQVLPAQGDDTIIFMCGDTDCWPLHFTRVVPTCGMVASGKETEGVRVCASGGCAGEAQRSVIQTRRCPSQSRPRWRCCRWANERRLVCLATAESMRMRMLSVGPLPSQARQA